MLKVDSLIVPQSTTLVYSSAKKLAAAFVELKTNAKEAVSATKIHIERGFDCMYNCQFYYFRALAVVTITFRLGFVLAVVSS